MTLFSDVYAKFTTMFKDATLSKLTQPTLEELFDFWRSHSDSIQVKEIRKDLEDVDIVLKQYNETLTSEEQWLIAYGMRINWLDWKIHDEDALRVSISDRDYTITSRANMLRSLNDMKGKTDFDLMLARQRYDNYEDIIEVF